MKVAQQLGQAASGGHVRNCQMYLDKRGCVEAKSTKVSDDRTRPSVLGQNEYVEVKNEVLQTKTDTE